MTNTPSFWMRLVVIVQAGIVAFFIALVLQTAWSALIVANLKTSPAIPWSVPVIVIVVWLAWQYLGGKWWPRSTAESRRRHLRARAVPTQVFLWAVLAGVLSVAALAGYWIVMTQIVGMPSNALPDTSKYPWFTVALVIAAGSLIGPVMEQAGFWGYGQVMLEKAFSAPVAIVILSILFGLGPHPPMGAVLWPKFVFYFLTSVTFGAMAFFTNSILPGLVVHILGDLTFFTVVWPHDSTRPLVGESTPDAWFWIHAAQAIVFTALAVSAFKRLAKIGQPARAGNIVTLTEPQMNRGRGLPRDD